MMLWFMERAWDTIRRLEALFQWLQKYNITLRRAKCKLGIPQVSWSSKGGDDSGLAPTNRQIKKVKSFLQTVQFCQVFMRPRQTGGPQTYADITLPLRRLRTASNNWRRFWHQSTGKLRLNQADKSVCGWRPSRSGSNSSPRIPR